MSPLNLDKILYKSNNETLFKMNFAFWFSIKLFFAFYYGMNIFCLIYGLLGWSFWEYTYHRFIMHGLKNTKYYYRLHGFHHQYPNKPSHIPMIQYITVSSVIYTISYINASVVFSYSVGHLIGFYLFENMHYNIHNGTDKNKVYIKYHLYHHQQPDTSFCFTTPCFDIIFGTFPYKRFSYNVYAFLPIPYIGFYGVQCLFGNNGMTKGRTLR
jgi:hypothetical protein